MDKTITTALLIIASVIAAVALTNAILPAVSRGSSAVLTSSQGVADRVRTDLSIVFAGGDTADTRIDVWIKNVGTERVDGIDSGDLFLTTPSEIKRIPYQTGVENWTYTFETGTEWVQAITIKVVVELSTLPIGQYIVKYVAPNGAVTEKTFSV